MMKDVKVGDEINGGRDFGVERTVVKRLSCNLWLVRCVMHGNAYHVKFTTREIIALKQQYGGCKRDL